MTEARDRADRIVCITEAGAGPIAQVWLAERRSGSATETVALKVLARRFPRDLDVLAGIRDRGRAFAAIGHPNVVPVVDLARVGPRLALIRPWVAGLDVLEWIEILRERDVLVPARVVCEIVAAAAAALDATLATVPPGADRPLGIEHRDFKPQNILIGIDGGVRVVDFASGFTSIAGRSARAGALQKGLGRYLSPARREGKRGGPPADVYALGILAVELFRGRWLRRLHLHNPAHDRHLAEVVARLDHLDMRTRGDELGLRNALLRMVAWDAEGRPSAGEVAATFRTLAERAPGPTLAEFGAAHLVPLVPPPAADPGEAVPGEVIVLPDDLALVDIPSAPAEPEEATKAGPRWEETEEGWRIIEEIEDDPTLSTPPAAAPRTTQPPVEDAELTEDTTTSEVARPVRAPPPTLPPPAPSPVPAAPRSRLPVLALLGAGVIGAFVGAGLLLLVLALVYAA